ncbi:MAG: hypothetical protein ABIQ99_00090, partial [Thermoflexales bacterium]
MNARAEGNFNYVPGSGIFCKDVVPHEGYAVAHAVFLDPPPVARAFDAIKAFLAGIGRPIEALCGSELRIPRPLSFDGFDAFNKTWMALLDQYGLRAQGGQTPLGTATRTNVSPEAGAGQPAEPSFFGFSYTVPGRRPGGRKTFVSSGAGELPGSGRESIIRLGDTSPDGMREKARWVMASLVGRLPGLGVGVEDVTTVNLYCVHPPESYFASEVLASLGARAGLGVHWYYARP